MYRKYINDNDIIERFSPFKEGDTVTLLKQKDMENGFFEAGTVMKVAEVSVTAELNIPSIPSNEIGEWTITNVHNAFSYKLKACGEEDTPSLYCNIGQIAKGKIAPENIDKVYKENNHKPFLEKWKWVMYFVILIMLIGIGACLLKKSGKTDTELISITGLAILGVFIIIAGTIETNLFVPRLKIRKEAKHG